MELYEPVGIVSEYGKHRICCYFCYETRLSIKKFSDTESVVNYFSSFGWRTVKGKWHCEVCANIVYYAYCEEINKCVLQKCQIWPVMPITSELFSVPDGWIPVKLKKDFIKKGYTEKIIIVNPEYLYRSYEDALAGLLKQAGGLAKDLDKE